MPHDVIRESRALSVLFERLLMEGTHPRSPYGVARTQLGTLQVTHEEADLFALVLRHAWEREGHVTPKMWEFAKAHGEDVFRELGDVFDLCLDGCLRDMSRMMAEGMTVQEICMYPLYDDAGANSGILSVDGVLALRAANVPPEFYAKLCAPLSWQYHPTGEGAVELHQAGVPVEYATRALGELMKPGRIIECWSAGLPIEYALSLGTSA